MLVQKCCVFCFAKNKDAALTFCWCWTFSKGKCSANQNVRKRQNAVFFALQKTKAVQKCCVFCFAKNKDAYILFCKNAFDAYILFCKNAFLHQQNVTNAFDAKMHFCVHFPLENVQRTFSFGKCSAYIFQRKMFSTNKMLQMHLMLCKNAFLHHIL